MGVESSNLVRDDPGLTEIIVRTAERLCRLTSNERLIRDTLKELELDMTEM